MRRSSFIEYFDLKIIGFWTESGNGKKKWYHKYFLMRHYCLNEYIYINRVLGPNHLLH